MIVVSPFGDFSVVESDPRWSGFDAVENGRFISIDRSIGAVVDGRGGPLGIAFVIDELLPSLNEE